MLYYNVTNVSLSFQNPVYIIRAGKETMLEGRSPAAHKPHGLLCGRLPDTFRLRWWGITRCVHFRKSRYVTLISFKCFSRFNPIMQLSTSQTCCMLDFSSIHSHLHQTQRWLYHFHTRRCFIGAKPKYVIGNRHSPHIVYCCTTLVAVWGSVAHKTILGTIWGVIRL